MAFFMQPVFIWFLVAVAFLIAEMMAPGFVAIFFTLGCLAASLSSWLFEVSLSTQIIIFVVVAIGSLVLFRRLARKIFMGTQGKDQADDYFNERLGKRVVVTEPIAPLRQGKVKLDGSFWIAMADVDMAEGDVGVVTGVDAENSLIVNVKPIES